MAEEDLKTYTTGHLAKMFNVSPQTIKNWCAKLPTTTKTPGGKSGQGHRRFTKVHIEAIKKLMNPEPPPAPPINTSEAGHASEF